MFIRKINYTVTPDGIEPLAVQRGGLQGEHNATGLIFSISSGLLTKLSDLETVGNRILYRFEAYTGTGLKSSTVPKVLDTESIETALTYPLEHWLTREGGNIRVYLIFSVLDAASSDTLMDLYTYPALIRLEAVPEAEFTDGENYDSLATLSVVATKAAEAAETSAEEAAESAIAAEEARTLTEEARLALEGGAEFIFLGGDAESSVSTDLVIDEELSAVSGNPVQNRAVTEALSGALVDIENAQGTMGGLQQYIDDVNARVTDCEEKVSECYDTVNSFSDTVARLDTTAANTADYVIEQGTDGIWSYTKWNSGRITLHYSTRSGDTVSCITPTGTAGAIYCSDDITFDVPAQCIAFDEPQSTGSITSMYSGVFTWTQDRKIYCKFWSLGEAESAYRLVLDLEGRWK